jgi:hypothetical protein
MTTLAALRRFVLPAFLILVASVSACHDRGGLQRFDIRRQPAADGLNEFARQANITIVFPFDLVLPMNTHDLHGEYPVGGGLRLLLDGTGLGFQQLGPVTYAICDRTRCSSAEVAGEHR